MRKGRLLLKKAFAGLLAVALLATGINIPGVANETVKAAENEIVLPITLRDFNADNLLFEYCLEKDSVRYWGGSEVPYLSFTDATFASRIEGTNFVAKTFEQDGETFDASYVENLVQSDLVDGHVQYRQETVEAVAEVVKGALEVPVGYDMKNYYAEGRLYTYQEELYREIREKLGTPVGDGKQPILNPYITDGDGNNVTVLTSDDAANPELFAVTVELGDYTTTKAKADSNQLSYDTLETAMDYAYYMLNNFFVSKNDINYTYDNFKNITLKGDGEGNYTFDARKGENVGYYEDTKNISNDTSQASYTSDTGLFPLDKVSTNENKYLDNFSQASIDYDVSINGDASLVKDKTPGEVHNFHYSLAGHSRFYYYDTSDLYFYFQGDDDVYLYINGKLALDLGGAHSLAEKGIELNDLKDELGLENGKVYDFDFFYMDRHTTNANLYIKTNIKLLDKGEATVNLSTANGTLDEDDKVQEGTDKVYAEYNFKANADGVKDIVFADVATGITISKDGISKNDDVKLVNPSTYEEINKLTVETTINGVTEKQEYTSDEIKTLFSNLTLNTDDTIKITGIETIAKDNDGNSDEYTHKSELEVTFDAPKYTGINGYEEEKAASAHQDVGLLIAYFVKYVEKGTDNSIADTDEFSGVEYNAKVTPNAKSIDGYKIVATPQEETIDYNNKVITLEYVKLLNVYFESEDENKGTLDGKLEYTGDDAVESGSTVSSKPETKANTAEGYTFTGWTKKVDGVDGETAVTDPLSEIITADTTFIAHFSKAPYKYSVIYVDKDGNNVADPDENLGTEYGETVTPVAKNVPGYKPDVESQEVFIDEDNKVIKFVYEKLLSVYFKSEDENKGTLDGTTEYKDSVEKGTTVTKPETNANTGYAFVGWTVEVDGGEKTETPDINLNPETYEITADTTFTAHFAESDYTYSVVYVDRDGNEVATADRDLGAKFNEVVTATAKTVEGYTPETESKQITIDADKKVIEIVYDKNAYNVVFTTDGNGTIEGTKEFKVNYKEKVENVPNKTPKSNYEFLKWTMTVNGETTDVEDPATVEITADTVFTAIFKEVPTTEAPTTTVAPTTEAPTTTVAPTTEDPTTTVAPTTEDPTTTVAPTTEDPTTTVAPETEETTTKKKATTKKKTSKEKETTEESTTQNVVETTSPKTGYNQTGLFVAMFAGLAALLGGIVLVVEGRKKEEE